MGGLLLLVAVAPFFLGGNRPIAWSSFALLAGLLLILWGVGVLRRPAAMAVPWRRVAAPILVFALLCLWFAFQASELAPPGWRHQIWRQTAEALGRGPQGAIALAPDDAYATLMRLLTYAAVFFLALQLGRTPGGARAVLWTLVLSAGGYALYGLAAEFSNSGRILWFDRWAYQGSLTATFVNRNSFAAYAGLALVATFAAMAPGLAGATRLGLLNRSGLGHFLRHLDARLFLLLGLAAVLASALLLSRSRGGATVTAVGLAVFLAMFALSRRARLGPALGLGLFALFGAAVVVSISGGALVTRFAELAVGDESGRAAVHALTARAIGDSPWLGTGLGSFKEVFLLHRDAGFSPQVPSYQRAHSTYLELALEAGLPAFAAMACLFLWMAALCLAGVMRRRRDGVYPAAGLGALALALAHSGFDFSLQIPGFAIPFFALVGVACAQSWRSDHASDSPSVRRAAMPGRNGRAAPGPAPAPGAR